MYPFLVHVERERVQALSIRTVDARSRAIDVRCHAPYVVRIDVDLERNNVQNYSSMETMYCETLEQAELVANKFAREMPGRAVYITELKAVVQSVASAPTISNWSEKGLIPR